jgi:hypothetical protein
VPSLLWADEIATISACRVTSPSTLTKLSDSQTNSPRREMTAANGYSPCCPADWARVMQRRIMIESDASEARMLEALAFTAWQCPGDDFGILPPAQSRLAESKSSRKAHLALCGSGKVIYLGAALQGYGGPLTKRGAICHELQELAASGEFRHAYFRGIGTSA